MGVRQAAHLAAAFLGCVLGAGFSSGQEHLRFFLSFGPHAFVGMGIAGLLFFLSSTFILETARSLQTRSHRDLFAALTTERSAMLFDALFSVFMFGALVVMFAAGGVIFQEGLDLPFTTGVLLLVVLSIATAWGGMQRLLSLNGVLILILVILLVVILWPALSQGGAPLHDGFGGIQRGWIPNHWLAAATVYVAYNIGLVISPFAALGQHITHRKSVILGMALGAFSLTAIGWLMLRALAITLHEVAEVEVPLLAAARLLSPGAPFRYGYVVAMLIAILTSCVSILYGLMYRIAHHTPFRPRTAATLLPLAAFPLAHMGFGTLVQTLYPTVGYISCALLLYSFGRRLLLRPTFSR